jgi:hypothetical protein
VREQPLQRVHALRRGDGRVDPGARRGLRDPDGGGRRAGRARRAAAAERAVERARVGRRPLVPPRATYRYHGHHVGDVDRAYYRSKEEEELWTTERDPIDLLARRLGDDGAVAELR